MNAVPTIVAGDRVYFPYILRTGSVQRIGHVLWTADVPDGTNALQVQIKYRGGLILCSSDQITKIPAERWAK